jgi:heat shock protein HtpX
MSNLMKTPILMAAITALFMLLGRMLGGQAGMLLALALALGMNFFSDWFSDKIVLKMYKAREVDDSTAPQFVAMVRELANMARVFGGRGGQRSNPVAASAVALLAPLAASLIQMAISRAREFEADRGGAGISGDPAALASALDKIQRHARGRPMEVAERHPETAQMMIMNPLSAGGLRGLFSTHPPTEERVAALMAMAQAGRHGGR